MLFNRRRSQSETTPVAPFIQFHLMPGAKYPTYAHGKDAGLDLTALTSGVLEPGAYDTVSTGVSIRHGLPTGYAGLIVSRSGLASKYGVHVLNSPGLIDPGYTGELKVVLHNSGTQPYVFKRGDRIAQLVITTALTGTASSQRGNAGLGSTGVSTVAPTAGKAPEANPAPGHDDVNSPQHYADHPLFEGEAWNWVKDMPSPALGNTFKYLWRHAAKADPVKDLSKSLWYLERADLDSLKSVSFDLDQVDAMLTALVMAAQAHKSMFAKRHSDESSLESATYRTEEDKALLRLTASLSAWTALVMMVDGLEHTKEELKGLITRAIDLYSRLDPEDRVNPGAGS